MKLEKVGNIRVDGGENTETIVECITSGLTDYHYVVDSDMLNVSKGRIITLFKPAEEPVTQSGEENIENEG